MHACLCTVGHKRHPRPVVFVWNLKQNSSLEKELKFWDRRLVANKNDLTICFWLTRCYGLLVSCRCWCWKKNSLDVVGRCEHLATVAWLTIFSEPVVEFHINLFVSSLWRPITGVWRQEQSVSPSHDMNRIVSILTGLPSCFIILEHPAFRYFLCRLMCLMVQVAKTCL